MTNLKIEKVFSAEDGATIDMIGAVNCVAITGVGGSSSTGDQGVAIAGAKGLAKNQRYGVAIVGPEGRAEAGATALAFAYDGGSAAGGDGSVAWARRNGAASTGGFGMALTLDGDASAASSGIAMAVCQNKAGRKATASERGVAVVRNHPGPVTNALAGLATSGPGGVSIAYDDHHVSGAMGTLLVAVQHGKGGYRFATGVVDWIDLLPGKPYKAGSGGTLIPA